MTIDVRPRTANNATGASLRRRVCLLLLAAALAAVALAPPARADGDPGSDVLVYQPLFLGSDSGISVAQQVRLGALLQAAAQAGFPIRVAIISSPSDLGAITELWGKPRAYARFLGLELAQAYRGRLLVVMPGGFGFNWPAHPDTPAYRVLAAIKVGRDGAALAGAARAAVSSLAAAAHVRLPPAGAASSEPGANPGQPGAAPGASAGGTRVLAFVALASLAAAILAARIAFSRRRATIRAYLARARRRLAWRPRRPAALLTAAAVLAGALTAGAVLSQRGLPASDALATNPLIDPGTPLSRPAPDFTLSDQFGTPASLHAFRGKVVMLAFNDSECTSVCPLTTTAMLDAKAMLGSAGNRVQLLGIDANPKATSIEDVLSYSQLHGMLRAWRFLTGPLPALERVWKAYSIGVAISQRVVDHTPATFVIDPHGQLRKLYITQQSYATVKQLGQLLATEAASLLRDHPPVHSHLGYARIAGINPATRAALPRAQRGTLTVGPSRARLYLFFATWDRQITGLAAGLQALNRYQALARRTGLPSLTAIDEASVEPHGALNPFLHTLSPLAYPVALDTDGRLADGYEVQGQPWLMLVSPSGQIAWYYSVANLGWPSTAHLANRVKAALARVPGVPSNAGAALAGSPSPLALLHRQAAHLLGQTSTLTARIRALAGYPIVINVWASWCTPCRAEFGLFANASIRYGRQVAFLGANYKTQPPTRKAFSPNTP